MEPASLSDTVLLNRWKGGDMRAGNALFERHFDSLYRFFVHKAPDAATDLVQRTFLACVVARDQFRGASSFRTFAFAIARRELFAHWRNERSAPVDSVHSSLVDIASSPSSVLVRRSEHRLLLDALRSIPIDLQIALELHYWEEMSGTEIAGVLGVPVGTAKSRLRRAREVLAEKIHELESDPALRGTTLANLEVWAVSLKEALLVEIPPW